MEEAEEYLKIEEYVGDFSNKVNTKDFTIIEVEQLLKDFLRSMLKSDKIYTLFDLYILFAKNQCDSSFEVSNNDIQKTSRKLSNIHPSNIRPITVQLEYLIKKLDNPEIKTDSNIS